MQELKGVIMNVGNPITSAVGNFYQQYLAVQGQT